MTARRDDAVLVADGLTKHFDGAAALDAVSLWVGASERVGLIGPNGAGKTTLFNCLLGLTSPDSGAVWLNGVDASAWPPYVRARHGLGRTFQRIEVFAGMTPLEHMLVADRAARRDGGLWKDLLGRGFPTAAETGRARALLARLGLETVADNPIESLTLGQCRLVEVGRALLGGSSLLMLDEPSSGLDAGETARLTSLLLDVQREFGLGVLLVEHDVAMVRDFTERLYVLDAGVLLAEGPTGVVLADPVVQSAYLGSAR